MPLTTTLIFLATLTFISVSVAQPPSSSRSEAELQAEIIMNEATNQMKTHSIHLRSMFLASNKPDQLSKHLIDETFVTYRNFTVELAQNLSVLPYETFQNEPLKQWAKVLSRLKISGLDYDDYNEAQRLLSSMKNFSTDHVACLINDCADKVPYLPYIESIISRSNNYGELAYYWKAWRDAISKPAREDFIQYLDLYRKTASLNGHITPSKTWYLHFDEPNFLKELTDAMDELMPLYKEFHAFMRAEHVKQYGTQTVSEDGPIEEHLFDQILQHAWKPTSFFKPPYPNVTLPNVNQEMDKQGFTPGAALRKAAEFYESIGLEKLPFGFWNNYAHEMTEKEGGPDCKATVYSFPPDVGIKYCHKIDYKKFLQLHGNMAEIQYNVYRNRLPYGLNSEAFPGLSNAIGEAVIVSASSHRHLETLHYIDNYEPHPAFNRLFRMGVHTIFTLPRYFVYEKFFVDALDQKIKTENLNCGYWDIQEKYLGVIPPEDRSEAHFDPGYKFYTGLNDDRPTTAKILSELLGYQIYRALCIKTNQYIPGNDNYPLHNCDFFHHREAGKPLKDIMSLGSSQNWRDVLEILTGERRVSASALIEYYGPLLDWVKEQNMAKGVKVGWTSNKRCSS